MARYRNKRDFRGLAAERARQGMPTSSAAPMSRGKIPLPKDRFNINAVRTVFDDAEVDSSDIGSNNKTNNKLK